jgi:hypothetical protein
MRRIFIYPPEKFMPAVLAELAATAVLPLKTNAWRKGANNTHSQIIFQDIWIRTTRRISWLPNRLHVASLIHYPSLHEEPIFQVHPCLPGHRNCLDSNNECHCLQFGARRQYIYPVLFAEFVFCDRERDRRLLCFPGPLQIVSCSRSQIRASFSELPTTHVGI